MQYIFNHNSLGVRKLMKLLCGSKDESMIKHFLGLFSAAYQMQPLEIG